MQTGGRGSDGYKHGLAYTPYDDSALQHVTRPPWLSPDVKICSVRVTRRYRIFGALMEHVFYLLWFDYDHEIAP